MNTMLTIPNTLIAGGILLAAFAVLMAYFKNRKEAKTKSSLPFLSAHTAKSSKHAVELIKSQFEIQLTPGHKIQIDSLSGVNTKLIKLSLGVQMSNPSEYPIVIEQVRWELWLGPVVQTFVTTPRIKLKARNQAADFSTQESLNDQDYLKLARAGKASGYIEGVAICKTDFGRFEKKFMGFDIPYEVKGILGPIVEGAQPETPANLDSLTGLLQRKFIEENFQTIIDTVGQHKPISLIMFDIDHFKQFNDTHGHLIGDEILKIVCLKLKEVVAEKGLGIRYGGDEFCIILEGVDSDEAEKIAKNLHQAVGECALKIPQGVLRITLSVGVAVCRLPVDYHDLIKMADKALYESKRKGRNQVTADHSGVL